MNYGPWIRNLNEMCVEKFGISVHCLEGMMTREWHEDGLSPEEAFKEVILELEASGQMDELT